MTSQKDLKKIIRARQQKTGESYTTARAHVMRDRSQILGIDETDPGPSLATVEATVLKVNDQSARIRILGEEGQVTFRSGDIHQLIPGHLVTVDVEKRWIWRGESYASGKVKECRIDVSRLGLQPLQLTGGHMEVLAETTEPFRHPDPYVRTAMEETRKPTPAVVRVRWDRLGRVPGTGSGRELDL